MRVFLNMIFVHKKIQDGGSASGKLVTVVEDKSIEELVQEVELVHTAVYNLGAQIGDRSLEKTSTKAFEMGWWTRKSHIKKSHITIYEVVVYASFWWSRSNSRLID